MQNVLIIKLHLIANYALLNKYLNMFHLNEENCFTGKQMRFTCIKLCQGHIKYSNWATRTLSK